MSEYSPDIRSRAAYEKPREDEILELRELMLDFAEEWPERAVMQPDKIISEARAEHYEDEWTAANQSVRVFYRVKLRLEDYSDAVDHERYIATIGTRVVARLPEVDELDGQLFAVANPVPPWQQQRYIVTFSGGQLVARVASMDMRLNRTTVRTMTRYDLTELTKALNEYMVTDDDVIEYIADE